MGVAVNKLLLFLLMGFLARNAFAEEQGRQVIQEKSTASFIGVKVPDTIDSANALVSEMLVYQGQWVQAGEVVAKLKDGEEEADVRLSSSGVVIKVLAGKGAPVSQGTVLFYMKRVNTQRPDFRAAWEAFYDVNVGVPEVGNKIGGKVKHNIDIPELKDGKWKNACSIRMSYVLNRIGFPIQEGKYSTAGGADGMRYMYRLNDMLSFLRDVLGEPDIEVNNTPSPKNFREMKGILAVTGEGRGDANGHITLWNGLRCSDICHLTGDPRNIIFKPRKAALWLLP